MKIDICLAKMMEYKSMDKGYVIVIKIKLPRGRI